MPVADREEAVMAIAATGTLPAIDEVQLATVVRIVLDAPAAIVEDGWRGRPLSGGFGEGVGIWWLDGSARIGSVRREWAVVLKSLSGGGGASTWDDLRRE